MKKTMLVFALTALCLFCLGCASAEQMPIYTLGSTLEDFTVISADGESVTLSDVLKEKDVVLINLWATWCSACCHEFPMMEEAYLQYRDQVEIIALSTEEKDTPDVLKKFAQSENLSFILAQDTPDFFSKFALEAIPCSIVVDRFGTVCYIAEMLPDAASFMRLFDVFVGDDYTQSLLLNDVPPEKPRYAPSAPADIAAALDTANAQNPADVYTWPMLAAQKDGRSVVVSSNTAVLNSVAAVSVRVDAKAGDAIAVTFKTSTEGAADILSIRINGETVKLFGGEHDWMTYAVPVEADGSYDVTLSYSKDAYVNGGEDTVWIDSVSVLSGAAAADALHANPAYPVADAITFTPVGCESKEIVFKDDLDVLPSLFTNAVYYLVDTDSVTFHTTLTADIDPEGAFFSHMFEGSFFPLSSCMTENGYVLTREVASVPESVIPFTGVILGLDPAGTQVKTVLFFRNEESIENFISTFALGGWSYADEKASPANPLSASVPSECTYTIRCVDQNGAPVAGALIQICDDSTCRVAQSNADGLHSFTSAPCSWEIHVLAPPSGYTADSEALTAPFTGGEITLTLNKN